MFAKKSSARRRVLPLLEALETREVPATVTVNAGQVLRPVADQILGVNLVWWDSNLNTAQTRQLVQAAGLDFFRLPGGSSSDDWHFNAPPTYNGEGTIPGMASFIASVGGAGLVTLDYGSGSPQEAAALLAYLNAPTTSTVAIGSGPEWSDSTSAWVTVDWKTAGYWAGLRAAAPLAQDDGLNFLRLGRSAPFGLHYFEVGNEEYGGWEIDHHAATHDPATYVTFARQFAAYAGQIDPSVSIGIDTGSPGGDNNWTANVLQQGVSQGFTPGFLSDHSYVQAPGSESDSTLLLNTVSNPAGQNAADPFDWAARAAAYRQLLNQTLGASAASHVELLATEFNSVYSNPGKQTTSLVNGLFVADSLGSLLETDYNGALVWDLRNSWETGNNNSASLYGWRQGGDYGLLGDGGGPAPATGTDIPYPSYFAEQLVAQMIHPGDSVITASSSDANLGVYAVREATGHLDLLVINKSPTTDLAGQFQVSGFTPAGPAQVWQYGKTQDTAQSHTTDGHSALANFTASLTVSGSAFSYTFPSYSMTVLDLAPATAGNQPPTVAAPAAATPNPVSGTTTALSVLGADDRGEANLTYTWATTGTPPAPVAFSPNGSNAAKNSTATFTQPGTYVLQVTITDAGGLSVTSSVTVTVTAPSPNQAYVTQLYHDLLGRSPDPAGLAAWSGYLDQNPGGRFQVAWDIETSGEARTRQVNALYQTLLNRPADAAGLSGWLTILSQGGTLAQVETYILGSGEYYAGHGGGSAAGFVAALYHDVLGRTGSTAEESGWVQFVAQGGSRTVAAALLLNSPESDADRINRDYTLYLGRPADSTGLNGLAHFLAGGGPEEVVVALLLASDEYYTRA